MTKFVKIKEHGGDNIVINLDHVEQIQSLASENLLSVITATGTHFIIHEDDWRMLGIDLVQELHSGWEKKSTAEQLGNALQHLERQRCAEMEQDQDQEYKWTEVAVSLGGSATFVDSDLCQGEPASFTLGKFAVETHQFGTQQYVKDTSVKDES